MTERNDIVADIEAEKHFLSAVFYKGANFTYSQTKVPLSYDMFYSKANQVVFLCIQTMADRGAKDFSPSLILDYAKRTNTLKYLPGGMAYLSDLQNLPTTAPEDAEIYAKNIFDDYTRRKGILALKASVDMLEIRSEDENDVQHKLLEAERLLHEVQDGASIIEASGPKTLNKIAIDWWTKVEAVKKSGSNFQGLKTGFYCLDNIITGLRPGTMNIIAAQPGVGKTALAVNMLTNIVTSNECTGPVVFFSLEMTSEMLLWRVLSQLTEVPVKKLQNNEITKSDEDKLTKAFSKHLENFQKKFYIDESGYMKPALIRQRCRRIADRAGVGISCIVIDHVQIMNGDKNNYNNDVSKYAEISRSLKIISKEFNCPVIVLSQLSRKIDDRKDHEPKNSDLKETSGLEQDADLIVFIQRDMSDPDSCRAQLKITKNRHGALGTVELYYNKECTLFKNPIDSY